MNNLYKQHKIAHAGMNIYSDTLDIEFWTHYFGVQPDRAFRKGETLIMPNGKIARGA